MSRFYPADILLPDFKKADGEKYAVVACDQFTSEPAVWDETESIVGEVRAISLITIHDQIRASAAQTIGF